MKNCNGMTSTSQKSAVEYFVSWIVVVNTVITKQMNSTGNKTSCRRNLFIPSLLGPFFAN